MRRALTIAAIVIAFVGLGVVLYFLFFASGTPTLQTGTTTGTNPFGTGAGNTTTVGNNNTSGAGAGTVTINSPTAVASRLIEITRGPIALGMVAHDITSTSTGTTTADIETDYVDRASGNIFSYLTHANLLARLTARTIPGVQEAVWLANGTTTYARFLTTSADGNSHIQTYGLPSNGAAGFFLANDISNIVSATTTSILAVTPSGTGSIGTLLKADGTGGTTLFSSPIARLILRPAGKNYLAYTPASAEQGGYAFTVDGKSGAFTRILGPVNGLVALPSPSGATVLYSYVTNGTLHLGLIDTTSRKVTPLPIATLAEKCVWSVDSLNVYCAVPQSVPAGTLPDDWYQGAVSFTDRIWRIDVVNRLATLTVDVSSQAKQPIDAVGLSIDPKSEVLDFMNKRDGSLWSYDL